MLQFLLGPSLHPGGLGLTKELARKVELSSSDTVLDMACGLGESIRFLAKNYGCSVLGIDLSKNLLQKARAARESEQEELVVGDGELLPVRDSSFTVVISECSMCLMPEFGAALKEIVRTLRPGGRIGITDFATNGQVPHELEEALMKFLCISRNPSVNELGGLLIAEGFENVEVSDQSKSLKELLEILRKRLLLAELLRGIGKLSLDQGQVDLAKRLVSLADVAVDKGNLSYVAVTAFAPAR